MTLCCHCDIIRFMDCVIFSSSQVFWRLDSWEDDSRRRRRLVKNALGTSHPEASLKAAIEHGATDDAINAARDAVHAHLARMSRGTQHVQDTSEEDLTLLDEKEPEPDLAGDCIALLC